MARLITALALLASTASTAYALDPTGDDAPVEEPQDEAQPDSVPVPEILVVSPVEAAAPVVAPVWDRLANCESSGRWSINTGNGYYGGLQEDMTFWRRYGGPAYASRPDLASKTAQVAVARAGQAVQGWGAWPRCSRILGLR